MSIFLKELKTVLYALRILIYFLIFSETLTSSFEHLLMKETINYERILLNP